jgi:uncharacterized membrane protein
MLAMGVLSGVIFQRADTWWHKSIGHFNVDVAEFINRSQRPLLIAGSATSLVSLSHSLDEKARILYIPNDDLPVIPARYSDVFILAPSEKIRDRFQSSQGSTLDEVLPRGKLYRVVTEQARSE